MRILLVANYLPPYEGGIQFVVDELARGYARLGHEVVVSGYDPAADKRGRTPYEVAPLPAWNPLERFSIPIPLFAPTTLVRRTTQLVGSADAVHLHGVLYPNVWVAGRLAHRLGRPSVVTEHVGVVSIGSPVLDAVQRRAFDTTVRYLGARARAVTVLNERVESEVAAALDRLTPARRPPVRRLDNGVDRDLFSPTDERHRSALRRRFGLDRPAALFVGRRSRKKGLDLVLDAASKSTTFDVIVCGKDTESVEPRSGNVRVIGLLGRDELADLYRAADVLVLPSEGEGFPLVVQEALVSGIPAIVGPGTLPADARRMPGITITERDPAAIADAIGEVIRTTQDADGRQRLRSAAVERFDWDVAVRRYLDLLCPTGTIDRTGAAR